MSTSVSRLLSDSLCERLTTGLSFIGDRLFINLPPQDRHILSIALAEGWVPEERFREAIHKGICNDGRISYTNHLRGAPIYGVYSLEALMYAIEHQALTKEEIGRIRFDPICAPRIQRITERMADFFEGVLAEIRLNKKPDTRLPESSARIEMGAWDYCEGCSCC